MNPEKRIPNGTIVTVRDTGEKLQIIDAIETNNQFGYGVFLYKFLGKGEGFGLYLNEIKPNGY